MRLCSAYSERTIASGRVQAIFSVAPDTPAPADAPEERSAEMKHRAAKRVAACKKCPTLPALVHPVGTAMAAGVTDRLWSIGELIEQASS